MPRVHLRAREGDMREDFQAAITAAGMGGTVELDTALYRIGRGPRIQSLRMSNCTLEMNGATLSMHGSSLRAGESVPGDWTLLELSGYRSIVRNGVFRADDREHTNEQTHLIQVKGPSDSTLIENPTFVYPHRGHGQGGDCIRLLGEADALVMNTTVRNAYAPQADRSFLGLQRGVKGLMVEDCVVLSCQDQAIDMEATGVDAFGNRPCIEDVTVTRSRFSAALSANAAMAIGGRGLALADRIVFDDVQVFGGSVNVLDAGSVTLRKLLVRSEKSEEPALLARRRIRSLRLIDCDISNGSQSTSEAAMKVGRLSNISPEEVVIVGSIITSMNGKPALRLEHTMSCVVIHSSLGGPVVGRGQGQLTMVDTLAGECDVEGRLTEVHS